MWLQGRYFVASPLPLLEYSLRPPHKEAGLALGDERLEAGWRRTKVPWPCEGASLAADAATWMSPEETVRRTTWPAHRMRIINYFKPLGFRAVLPSSDDVHFSLPALPLALLPFWLEPPAGITSVASAWPSSSCPWPLQPLLNTTPKWLLQNTSQIMSLCSKSTLLRAPIFILSECPSTIMAIMVQHGLALIISLT